MALVLLLARLLLAAVFVVAGIAKLVDLPGSRKAMAGFGLPAPFAGTLGLLLPLAELAVAVALLPRSSAWYGGVGALTLLLVFVAAIATNLARGRTPDCHCFGQIHSEPVGWPTLTRNAVLALVAGFVVSRARTEPGASLVGWIGALTTAERVWGTLGFVGLLLLLGQGWLLFLLLRQHGRMLLRLDAIEVRIPSDIPAPLAVPPATDDLSGAGLPIGAPAPDFSLADLDGKTATLDSLVANGKSALLFFTDPRCGPCNALLPDLGRWQREGAAQVATAIISRGTPADNKAKTAEHGLVNVLLQRDREVALAYRAYGTPSAMLVRPDGTVGSHLAQGADAIRALVARTMVRPSAPQNAPAIRHNGPRPIPLLANNGHRAGTAVLPVRPAGPAIGDPAPTLRLPDLAGNEVDLADFRGGKVLLVFWNPGCGFCQRLVPELKAWEAKAGRRAPKLLVVSTGTVEANRALGLRAPVLVQEGFGAGTAFGVSGTPSAVLIAADGRIASPVAVGGPEVLRLAQGG